MFLEWNSRELIRQERIATRHLLKRILALWRQDAERSKEDVVSRALLAGRSYVLRFPFRLWRKLLEASHLRRAQLAARGLSYLKVCISFVVEIFLYICLSIAKCQAKAPTTLLPTICEFGDSRSSPPRLSKTLASTYY